MHAVVPVARCDERGNAVIELALTLPLLLLIVMGIFDFGFMFQRYEVITNAAREGARVGVLPGYSTNDAKSRALQYLTVGGLNAPQVSCASLTVDTACAEAISAPAPITGSVPLKTVNQVTVTVKYVHQHSWVSPILELFGSSMGEVTLVASSTMRAE